MLCKMKYVFLIFFILFRLYFFRLNCLVVVCAGNLCNENNDTSNGSYLTPNNKRKIENDKKNGAPAHNNNSHRSDDVTTTAATTIDSCTLSTETVQLMNVSRIDRNKFCGSLPNHLDADDVCEENCKSKLAATMYNVYYIGTACTLFTNCANIFFSYRIVFLFLLCVN